MGFLSKATVSAVGLGSKALLNLGFCSSVTVNGLGNLLKTLEDEERNRRRGIVTMSNHISTLDDPVVWGVLPARFYRDSRRTRWTLGAADIMFTNPVFSTFFRYGQVIETFRGDGIFQPAIDDAIQKLNCGEWVHLFGEGKVNQESNDIEKPNAAKLLRFKWGMCVAPSPCRLPNNALTVNHSGRILMEAQRPPVIIPMWLTGFDKLMPEGRSFPYKFLPRAGAALSVTFGQPVPTQEIQDALATTVEKNSVLEAPPDRSGGIPDSSTLQQELRSAPVVGQGWLSNPVQAAGDLPAADAEDAARRAIEVGRVRSAVTAVIQRRVEALGRQVLGIQ
ncbi:acyltransferase-domain-containing protein [Ganoderma leucocontextum]|nr:acyltransferase-domain-containing protein [Ganoderma leucocontextum]